MPELVIPNAGSATETANRAANMPIQRERGESSTAAPERVFPKIDTSGKRRGTTQKAKQTRQDTTLTIAATIAAITFVLGFLVGFVKLREDGESDTASLLARSGIAAIATTIGVAVYMLPSLIAYNREHRNAVPILVINLFAGFFMLPWVGCLAWALSSHVVESRQTVRVVRVNERDELLDH